MLNYKVLCEILEEFMPEVIIHYAEQPSAPYSMASREKAVFTQQNNVIGNSVSIGSHTVIEHDVIVEDNVRIHSQAEELFFYRVVLFDW